MEIKWSIEGSNCTGDNVQLTLVILAFLERALFPEGCLRDLLARFVACRLGSSSEESLLPFEEEEDPLAGVFFLGLPRRFAIGVVHRLVVVSVRGIAIFIRRPALSELGE